jgi:PhnB protein
VTARAVPDGYHTATPYLIIGGAAEAIEFYKSVFGATERFRMPGPDDRIAHAEIHIGDSVIMLADEVLDMGYRSPRSLGGTAVSLLLYVDDVDAVFRRAVNAGAVTLRPVANQYYGDRSGTLEDPFGHVWTIATHIEDVPTEEIRRRSQHSSST